MIGYKIMHQAVEFSYLNVFFVSLFTLYLHEKQTNSSILDRDPDHQPVTWLLDWSSSDLNCQGHFRQSGKKDGHYLVFPWGMVRESTCWRTRRCVALILVTPCHVVSGTRETFKREATMWGPCATLAQVTLSLMGDFDCEKAILLLTC